MINALAPLDTAISADLFLSDRIRNATSHVANYLFVRPLANLYLDGPAALGFWGGVAMPDICAQLTNTNSQFWTSSAENMRECEAHVERHFNSWMVLTTTVTYFCATAAMMRWMLCRRRSTPAQVIYLQNGAPAPSKK